MTGPRRPTRHALAALCLEYDLADVTQKQISTPLTGAGKQASEHNGGNLETQREAGRYVVLPSMIVSGSSLLIALENLIHLSIQRRSKDTLFSEPKNQSTVTHSLLHQIYNPSCVNQICHSLSIKGLWSTWLAPTLDKRPDHSSTLRIGEYLVGLE